MRINGNTEFELYLKEYVDGTYAVMVVDGKEMHITAGQLETLAETFMHTHNQLTNIRAQKNPKIRKATPILAISGLGVDDDE